MAEKSTLRVESYRSPTSENAQRRGTNAGAVEDALFDYERIPKTKTPISDEDEFLSAFDLKGNDNKKSTKADAGKIEGRISLKHKETTDSDESDFLSAFGLSSSAPSDIKNVPTSKDDPFYKGAVPIRDLPEQSATDAFLASALEGIPIVGPAVRSGIEKAAAATRSVRNDTSYSNELAGIQDRINLAKSQNPKTSLAGDITGGIVGTLPLIAAAPTAFLGTGNSLLMKGATSVPANALLSGVDRFMRNGDAGEITTSAGIGGGVGMVAPFVGMGAQRLGAGIKGAMEPFTQKGQSDIADRYLAKQASGGPLNLDAKEYVPNSIPTLAQATANPGLATTERAVRDIRPNPFVERETSNSAARVDAFNALKGDELSLDNLIARRDTLSDPIREAAFLQKTQTDPTSVVDKIDTILKSPSKQRDVVVSALDNLKKKLIIKPESVDKDGNVTKAILETDPEQLYGIRKAIGDMLSPLSKGTETNKQLASKELQDIMKELDVAIENGAPGFKHYLSVFSDASKPIDEQKLLQGIKIFDAKGNVNLGPIDRLIYSIKSAQKANGVNQAKNVSSSTLNALEEIKKDLVRAQNSSLGKSIGSNSFQNLATANAANQMGVPLAIFDTLNAKPGAAIAMYFLRKAYSAKNDAIIDELVNKLLSPSLPTSNAFRGIVNQSNIGKSSILNRLTGAIGPVIGVKRDPINRLVTDKSE